jgi:hypothetical protein
LERQRHLTHCRAISAGQEVLLEERIDSMIDKSIKRLCQIKTMKKLGIGTRHASVTNEPLKQIDSPASQAAENK